MKRLLITLILTVILSTICSPLTAYANAPYYRVIKSGVKFYLSPNEKSALFELPISYYLKFLGEENGFYHIECYGESAKTPKLDGYVLKGSVVKTTDEPINPYLNLTVTTAKSTTIYQDENLTIPIRYVFSERTLGYYGKISDNDENTVYLITYAGEIGYILEDALKPFIVPLHQTPITESIPTTDNTTISKVTDATSESDLKSIVIIAVVLSSAIILGLIIIPERKNAVEQYAEDN